MKKRFSIFLVIASLLFLNACQSSEQNTAASGGEAAAAQAVEKAPVQPRPQPAKETSSSQAASAAPVSTVAVAGDDKAMQKMVPYEEGVHYTKLPRPFDTGEKNYVVVYEFFGYTCPHCSNFQPYMNPWHKRLPDNVKLVRVPVVFHSSWEPYARAYHTAEMMGIAEKTHQAMFDAIHKERKGMRTIEDIAQWYHDKFGVDKGEFLSTAKSFAIESKMAQSERMRAAMNVTSTPTLVIDGKYKPNPRALGSHKAVLQASDYLVQRSLQEKGLAGKAAE